MRKLISLACLTQAILSSLAAPAQESEFKGSFFTFTYSNRFEAQPDLDDFNVLHLTPASGQSVPWVKIYERLAPASMPLRRILAGLIVQMHGGRKPKLISSSDDSAIVDWNQGSLAMTSLILAKHQAGQVVILMITTTQAEWGTQADMIKGMLGNLNVAGQIMAWMGDGSPPVSKGPARKEAVRGDHKFQVFRDLAYEEFAESKLDLYVPEGIKNFPVVVWMHGGGLNQGDKGKGSNLAIASFLASMGLGVASLNYRLSPPVKFPVFNQDVAAGFAWVRTNVAEYGGDPDKLFVMGASAGGYLAASLTLNKEYLAVHNLSPGEHISATILISGLYDVHNLASSGQRLATQFGTSEEVIVTASPITYASKDAPPILFLFADQDGPGRAEMTHALAKALQEKGHKIHPVHEIPDRTHTSMGSRFAEPGDPVSALCLEFLNRFLGIDPITQEVGHAGEPDHETLLATIISAAHS